MKVYYSLEDLPLFERTVLTIGSFDGVHCGHQKIIENIKKLAQSIGSASVVVTFEPHPRLVLTPSVKNDSPPLKLLTSTAEKVKLLEKYGIDHVVIVPFTKAFSEQTPDDYIENFLVKHFKPAHVVIGYDHRFGANRSGDISYLKKFEQQFGYKVTEIEKQIIDDLAVSSTKIRTALDRNDIRSATKLQGHFFVFSGEIVKGQQIGRQIGFPTANIEIKDIHKFVPPHGIYAVFMWIDGKRYKGMMYRGDRPVLKEHTNVTIEVNLFDFNKDIYGKTVSVELVEFIRSDKNFESLEQLVIQLADDERECRDILQAVENQDFPRVAVVILNYNTKQFLRSFIPSVCETKYGNFDIYVADNGSTDGSIDTVQEMNLEGIPASLGIDRVKVIDLVENHGFAKGYNEALKHPKLASRSQNPEYGFDYYVLLNSDCRVSVNWMRPIIDLMESDKAIAIAQPKVLSYTKKRKFEYAGGAGGWIDSLGYAFSRGRVFDTLEKDRKQYEDAGEIFWASGAALFIKADLYHRFGGFDEDHWAHWEEIDLCWRVKRAGYKVVVEPKGVARHVGGGTLEYLNPRKAYLNFRNSLFTIFKNEKTAKLLWLIPLRLLMDGAAAGLFLKQGHFKHISAIIKAHFHFFTAVPHLLHKRKKYAQIVEKERIGVENTAGILRGSIVWKYYVQKKKYFKDLFTKQPSVVAPDEDEDDGDA
jgi:riboflavin kinase/FMN adenylyltransferase